MPFIINVSIGIKCGEFGRKRCALIFVAAERIGHQAYEQSKPCTATTVSRAEQCLTRPVNGPYVCSSWPRVAEPGPSWHSTRAPSAWFSRLLPGGELPATSRFCLAMLAERWKVRNEIGGSWAGEGVYRAKKTNSMQ
ncbi:hypothetical protein ElyMa_000961300 [Elysia marginata]|uniref:Uncharacterized protein n=1 Tax=Elysia marginata TaxID=1093978 RepID=A0AAV4HHS7_9GAST|nr:hypothetical protein ElyMa_000961300 [Elysia marginata]